MLLSSWNTIRVSHGLFPIFQLAHCAIYFFLFKHRITKTNCARAVNIANNSADRECAHTINKNYAHYLRNTCRNIAVCDKNAAHLFSSKANVGKQTNKQNRKQKDERDGNMSNKKYIHYYQSIVYNHTQRTKQSSIITDIQCVVQLERCD